MEILNIVQHSFTAPYVHYEGQMSECVVFAKHQVSSFQLYDGENKLHSMRWWCRFCTRPPHEVGSFYSACSLTQQSMGDVAPPGHIILIPIESVFPLTH